MKNIIPKQGTLDTVIERLLEFINLYDSNFSKKIKGASEEQILRYCELAKLKNLPPNYYQFLKTMGLKNGNLLNTNLIDFNLEYIIEFYEEILDLEPETLNKELPIIASYTIGDQVSLDLKSNTINPNVINSADGERHELMSVSLEHYLMRMAINYVERRRRTFGIWFSNTPALAKQHLPFNEKGEQSALQQIHILAKKLELNPTWLCEDAFQIFANNKMTLFAKIGLNNRVMIHIFWDFKICSISIPEYVKAIFGATGSVI